MVLTGNGWKEWELVVSTVQLDGTVVLKPVNDATVETRLHCSYDDARRSLTADRRPVARSPGVSEPLSLGVSEPRSAGV